MLCHEASAQLWCFPGWQLSVRWTSNKLLLLCLGLLCQGDSIPVPWTDVLGLLAELLFWSVSLYCEGHVWQNVFYGVLAACFLVEPQKSRKWLWTLNSAWISCFLKPLLWGSSSSWEGPTKHGELFPPGDYSPWWARKLKTGWDILAGAGSGLGQCCLGWHPKMACEKL